MTELAKKIVFAISKRIGYATTEIHNAQNLQNDGVPTVFLGNHNQGHNPTYMTFSMQKFLSADIHPVVRDTILKEKNWFFRELGRSLAYNAGAIPIQRRSEHKGKHKAYKNSLLTYKNILEQQEHLLIMPTGRISVTGEIDFSTDDVDRFEERHIRFIDRMMGSYADGSPRVRFQYIYSTTDEVFEKNHVYVGPSFTADKPIPYLEGMIQSTKIITGLQLHSFLKEKKSKALLFRSVMHLRDKGYIIPSPDFDNGDLEIPEKTFAKVIRAYARKTPVKELKLYDLKDRFGMVIVDSQKFQANQIMHLSNELKKLYGKDTHPDLTLR